MRTRTDLNTVSAPVDADTKATLDLVASDWNAEHDWAVFKRACYRAANNNGGRVSPNAVRRIVSNEHGLTIEPRRYSAFWNRAAAKSGFLIADGWVMNDDKRGRNAGKPSRAYRVRSAA